MERTLPALPSLQIPPPHLRSCKISKVSPLGLLHRPPSCQLRVKSFSRGAVKIQWRQLMGSSPCPPRFVCLFGDGNGKGKHEPDDAAQGAARKALEKALGGKRSAFSKWEETLKREADVGGRGSGRGGRGWFGGGGWEGFFDSGDDEDFWEETLHMTCALLAVCFLYMMIIAPREVIYFMAYITVNSVVNILNGVIYYVWWLRMKAKGYKLVKRPARRPLRSPEPYQRYHHTNADDDDMGDWD